MTPEEYEALETAVWESAARSDAAVQTRLRDALAAFRTARKLPEKRHSAWALLSNPATLVTAFATCVAFLFQQGTAASERVLERTRAHLEVRRSILDKYIAAQELEDRTKILRSAKLFASVTGHCSELERAGGWWLGALLFDNSQKAECDDRDNFERWMASEEGSIRKDLHIETEATAQAEALAATLQEQSDTDIEGTGEQASVPQTFVAEQSKRIRTELTVRALSTPIDNAKDAAESGALQKARVAWNRGYAAYQRGQRDEARAYYQQALQQKGDYFAALNSLGRMAVEDDKLEDGIAYYRRSLDAQPDYGPALYNIAIGYSKQADAKLACAALKQAQQRAPAYQNRQRATKLVESKVKCSAN